MAGEAETEPPSASFSGLAARLGVVLEGDEVEVARRLLASSLAVMPRYFDAREPAVMREAASVEEEGRGGGGIGFGVILERGRKRPQRGGQAKYCVLRTAHSSAPLRFACTSSSDERTP